MRSTADVPKKKPARKPKEDFTQVAFRVFKEAIGEAPPPPPETPLPPRAAAGRKGGLKGGKARAEKLTAEERREIARRAALTRYYGKQTKPTGE